MPAAVELELCPPYEEDIAVLKVRLLDILTVDECAVGAGEVARDERPRFTGHYFAVGARHARILDAYISRDAATNYELSSGREGIHAARLFRLTQHCQVWDGLVFEHLLFVLN